MEINPYDICPLCDSGRKFKWCCKDKMEKEMEEQLREDKRIGQENLRIYTEELLLRGIKLP